MSAIHWGRTAEYNETRFSKALSANKRLEGGASSPGHESVRPSPGVSKNQKEYWAGEKEKGGRNAQGPHTMG